MYVYISMYIYISRRNVDKEWRMCFSGDHNATWISFQVILFLHNSIFCNKLIIMRRLIP